MLKFLLIALLILWLCFSPAVRKLLRAVLSSDAARPHAPRQSGPARPTAMVPCAHCGVHLPHSDALFNDAGQPFCSEAHLRSQTRER
jgi:uncharacterized protein